jgi:hypothetical protein
LPIALFVGDIAHYAFVSLADHGHDDAIFYAGSPMPTPPKNLIYRPEFAHLLGNFHLIWSGIDQIVDYAICEFLKITPEQSHLLTSGLLFGRKAQLLAAFISRSDHSRKKEMLTALNTLRGEAKRDVVVHSYLDSTPTTVTFLHRSAGGEYAVKKHTYSLTEFRSHVLKVGDAARKLQEAVGVTQSQLTEFEESAIRAAKQGSRSRA